MGDSEFEHVEYKRSLGEWREIIETVAAFATAAGGAVTVGVGPDGARAGVSLGARTLEDLASRIKANTEPPQYPSIEVEGPEESALVTIRVAESPIKPVWAFGRPYQRVGRTNQRLTPDATRRLMEITTGRTWDALVCEGLAEEDLSREAIEDYLRRAGLGSGTATDRVLRNLNLISERGLSNAAALLFAHHPGRRIVSARIQCARFRDVEAVDFLDEQTVEGRIIDQLEVAQAFVARNTRQAIGITGRPEREVVPEYPEAAVREAITNALCHRDYAAPGGVQVRIHPDRLEVWNPARLPPDFDLALLYREHPSQPYNPLLAAALYRARLIEHWGSGTLRIVRECRERGLPQPEFRYEMGHFRVIFRVPPEPSGADQPGRDRSSLNDRQRVALEIAEAEGSITRRRYEEQFGVSATTAKRDLSVLVADHWLERVGGSRTIRYRVKSR